MNSYMNSYFEYPHIWVHIWVHLWIHKKCFHIWTQAGQESQVPRRRHDCVDHDLGGAAPRWHCCWSCTASCWAWPLLWSASCTRSCTLARTCTGGESSSRWPRTCVGQLAGGCAVAELHHGSWPLFMGEIILEIMSEEYREKYSENNTELMEDLHEFFIEFTAAAVFVLLLSVT